MHGSSILIDDGFRGGCSLPLGFNEQQATFLWCCTFFRATCLVLLRLDFASLPWAKDQCQLVWVLYTLG